MCVPRLSSPSVAESLDAPEDLITMDNGCVCCSVRGDLVRTLGQLAKRRKDFHAILLETTGLADPAPIVYVGIFIFILFVSARPGWFKCSGVVWSGLCIVSICAHYRCRCCNCTVPNIDGTDQFENE
jgi:CobW/HypB/UreG, nucleotide-binding domain